MGKATKAAANSGPLFWRLCPLSNMPPRARFERWLHENREIVHELVKRARRARAAGFTRYGMKALFEVVRYDRAVRRNQPDFKLNNNYTAPLARWIMREYPDLDGFFETRSRA